MTELTEAAIQWFVDRAGAVTYSMAYRNGPYSYDCSSSIYYALYAAGGNPTGRVGNTESMFSDLPNWGWYEVYGDANGIPTQRGDIFIWGDPGGSGGAAGHTGMFVDPENIIHCNYGYNGITVNNHDYIWSANGSPPCHIFRYGGIDDGTHDDRVQPVEKDWFDMATQKDLEIAVDTVIHRNDGFFRQKVHEVLHDEHFPREGSINGKPVGGMTTIAAETAWVTANIGGVKADVYATQKQVADLAAEVKALKEGK